MSQVWLSDISSRGRQLRPVPLVLVLIPVRQKFLFGAGMRRATRACLLNVWWRLGLSTCCLAGSLILAITFSLSSFSLYNAWKPKEVHIEGPLLNFEFHIRQSGTHWTPNNETMYIKNISNPIVCKNIYYHAMTSGYVNTEPIFVRRQLEWIENFPKDCFISVALDRPLRLRDAPSRWNRNPSVVHPIHHVYRVKFDVMSMLISLWRNGMLKSNQQEAPWLFFADLDLIPMNKNKSIDTLVERVGRGLELDTTEERLCLEEPELLECPPYSPQAKRPTSLDEIGYVIAVDSSCHTDWMYNAGAYMYKPSRLSGFMSSAILWSFNDTSMHHHFDHSDQGLIGLLLREVFDLHPDITRRICGYPLRESRWLPSLESDELVFVRSLNLNKALTHSVYRIAAQTWFPEGRFWSGEPTAVAIVAARWMNSPACRYNLMYSDARRKFFGFECGDMFAHLNGCHKDEYFDSTFRKLVGSENWCRDLLPFRTNDNGTGPFEYNEWLVTAREASAPEGALDPVEVRQFGD